MSSYYTRSGRESKAPDRHGPSTSRGVGDGTAHRDTATSGNTRQERQPGAASSRNAETEVRTSPIEWTPEMQRAFRDSLAANRIRREEEYRRGSGATPTFQNPVEAQRPWTGEDTRFLEAEMSKRRAERQAGLRGGSGPALSVVHTEGAGGSDGSVEIVEEAVNMPSRDAENSPQPQSHASNSVNEVSTGTDRTEGESRDNSAESEDPQVTTASGRPVPIPAWVEEEINRHRRAREREESILSEFPERPQPSINVGGGQTEFRLYQTDMKGSPEYRYGIETPKQQPLPTIYVRGTPDSEEVATSIGKGAGSSIPRPLLARTTVTSTNPLREPTAMAKANASGWRTPLLAAETVMRSVVDAVRGGKTYTLPKSKESVAPPPPPPKDPKPKTWMPSRYQSDDEYGTTTEIENFMSGYKTPPRMKAHLPRIETQSERPQTKETSDSEIDMRDRIPAAKKGKGRVEFAEPMVQPTPILADARRAEMRRRKQHQKELEDKARRVEEQKRKWEEVERKLEEERIRIEDEYNQTQYQLGVLASEQSAMEEAARLRNDVERDVLSEPGTSSEKEEVKSTEGEQSAAETSGNETNAEETDEPTTDVQTTESESTPQKPKGKRKPNKRFEKSVETSKAPKDVKRKEESVKDSKQTKATDIPEQNGEPLDVAMRTARLMFKMQKESIAAMVSEQLEELKMKHAPTYSPLAWRGSGYKKSYSKTPSTMADTATMSREQSEVRDATLSDSSSEKDTEEEEPKPRKRKKLSLAEERQRERRLAMKALKVEKPTPWSGAPIYDKFDRWVDQVDEWRRNHELSEYAVIATMGFLLTHDAKDWFKANVRDKEGEWTLEELNSALFNECFPPDMDTTLHEMWLSASQGSDSLRKWHKYVSKLHKRVPNLSEHDLRRKFMTGSHGWLQEKWAEMGFRTEDPNLTTEILLEVGLRYEQARAINTRTKHQDPPKSKGFGGMSSGGGGRRDQTHQRKEHGSSKPQEKGGEGTQRPRQGGQRRKDTQGPSGGRTNPKREPTEKEKAELRAQDRCFECREHGHTQRNCPKRREMTPTHKGGGKKPAIYNASLRFAAMKTKPGGPAIRLNMIEPLAAEGVIASERRRREEEKQTHRLQETRESIGLIGRILHTYLERQLEGVKPDHEWQRYLPSRKFRFKVETEAEGEFNVIDTWRGWIAHLPAAKLFENDFKISNWVEEMHKTAPIFIDTREPPATESSNGESKSEPSTEESSDGDLPDLEECWDLDTVYDEDSASEEESSRKEEEEEESTSESEGAKLWQQLRSKFRSRVALDAYLDPNRGSESDGENPPSATGPTPIHCAMAQTENKPRAKAKTRETKSKKKLWESLEDNSAKVKDDDRVMPHPIILTVYVNGKACRALLDSGAFSDFISTTLVDNLGLKKTILSQAMTLQMAVQGSRSKINARTTVDFTYDTIQCPKTFDIINIANYDMILGTPFFWQHKVLAGMNPTRVAIGAEKPLPLAGEEVHTILGAMSIEKEESLQEIRDMLAAEAKDLCEDAATSSLPPFRAINHRIPLIDDKKVYKYRPSKCPRPLEPMWREKSGEYLRTGRWRMAAGSNPIPILLIQKPRKNPEDPIKLRACFDKREQNANTYKLASPMPDQTEVLERIASHKYRSVIDGRDAYEQIRVEKGDVWKTLFNSPSGTMESLVLQQGDCNGPATYQSLMNHIFGPYIGVWMDVYLDDIMIYSDSLKDHIKHVRTVFKILREQKLFLNPKKMQFLAPELHVLGHRITDQGIKMDPYKVDSIAKWPTPTNKELVGQFIGAVGYLADGVRGIRIPMAVLNKLIGPKKIFRWGPTEQRAFEQTKTLVDEYCQKTRVPLSYEKGAPTIWLVTDASMTGAAGHVCQGDDWKTAKPVAFWSGKFSSAEQVYRTHEQEMLAIIESLKRFRHHLLGARFTIVTDHEKLEKFMTQKDLTRRQARWLETLSDFDFEIQWTSGKSNIFADALSRIYSNESKGTIRAASEHVRAEEDSEDDKVSPLQLFNMERSESPSRPIIVGKHIEAEMITLMAAKVRAHNNPKQGKEKRDNIWESDTSSEDSSASEYSEPSVSEARATRGGGKSRSSVPEKPINPRDSPRNGSTSAAPAPSKAASVQKPAIWHDRREESADEDGEPEIERSPENTQRKTSKKREYEAMRARQKAKKAPINRPRHPLYDSEGEEEVIKDDSTNEKPDNKSKEVKKRRSEIRDQLIQANEDMEEGRLPHPDEDSGSIEHAMDVRLTDVIREVEFPHDLKGRYAEDEFFKIVLKNPLNYANFEVVGEQGQELIYMKDSQRRILCIPDVSVGPRKAREIVITHAHSILAHLGARKTLWYLRENVWWKEMIKDITDYCASCDVCARSKATNQKPMGLLHPLKVPTRPWEQVGVDFVGPLPEAKNRNGAFDQVMVVIDHLTSMVHLIPTKINYRARQVAEIFYDSIYKLHGLPERIISDRDKIFTSIFWQNLHRLMRVNLKLSSTYHPQTDGATERANRTMVQMIRQAIGSKDSRWLERLPATEWAMNAARSETTGFSPFFLNYGYRPRPLIWDNASKDEYPGVFAFAQRMKDAILTAHDAILEKRVKQTRLANKGRRPAPFAEADLVYLSTKNIKLPKGKTRKLVPKYIGPYKITKVLVPGTSYRLDLPADLRSRGIHNAFHASLLRLYVPNCDTRFPGRQMQQLAAFGEADEDWEIARIRNHVGSAEDILFELEWTNGDISWEPLYRVHETEALGEYLEAMGVTKVKHLKRGTGKPPADDPETFIGMIIPTETEQDEDIRSKGGHGDESSPLTLITPRSLPPFPTPTASTLFFIMQQNKRRFDPRTCPNHRIPTLRTRMGTPFPEPRPAKLAPAFREARRASFDSLDIATAVAAAGTTRAVAKEIRANVARCSTTAAKRAQLYKEIKESPDLFFNRIGMRGISEKTWKDVERSKAGPIRNREAKVTFEKPAKADKQPKTPKTPTAPRAMQSQQQLLDSTNQLVGLVKDLLATTNLNNAFAASNMNDLIDIPPFLPKITPAPLPATQPNELNLDIFLPQDTVMGDIEIPEGETAQEPTNGSSEDGFEQIIGEETTDYSV